MTAQLTAACLTQIPGIHHGFFGRQGGVSEGVYASLNCGHGSRDSTEAVTENRRRVAASLGARGADDVLTLYQVHSAKALVVDAPSPRDRLPQADALVTRTPGLVVGRIPEPMPGLVVSRVPEPMPSLAVGRVPESMPSLAVGHCRSDGKPGRPAL